MEGIILVLQFIFVVVILYCGYTFYRKFKQSSIDNKFKIIKVYPMGYKKSAYVLKFEDKHYLCVDGCGMQEVIVNNEEFLDTKMQHDIFKKKFQNNIKN